MLEMLWIHIHEYFVRLVKVMAGNHDFMLEKIERNVCEKVSESEFLKELKL